MTSRAGWEVSLEADRVVLCGQLSVVPEELGSEIRLFERILPECCAAE